jgi:2-oxoglutarate ferredoxin oxidoreductase subunit delta
MKDLNGKMKMVCTKFFQIDPRRCKACWKCVAVCPKSVIGRVGFLWHKHIIIANGEDCSGCKRCVKICPDGVFTETPVRAGQK